MKLPKLFRRLTPIAAVAVAVFMVAAMVLSNVDSILLATLSKALFGIALVTSIVSFIGLLVSRSIENALLHRFGQSATAQVLAIAGTNEMVNNVGVYRVKLEVKPSSGEAFVSVAEDAIRIVNMLDVGDTVPVKYDPHTKEVALVMPKTVKVKRDDF